MAMKQALILAVLDLDIARKFYMEKLGFSEVWREGGWCMVQRDESYVRLGHCPGIRSMSECSEHSLVAQWEVDDAKGLWHEFKGNGVEVGEIKDQPWGYREFVLSTPDGHRFLVMEAIDGE
ncbi:VOC family protein [Poriferisphaera sp. WC338]|uniref:VOC family protein n=1 Tax=Poriferisphaera sp. WC338 TaxID=3425129 RepID=UPI003D81C03F